MQFINIFNKLIVHIKPISKYDQFLLFVSTTFTWYEEKMCEKVKRKIFK